GVRVPPAEGEPALTRGEALDGADVRATTAAEHERPFREVGGQRKALFLEGLCLDNARLWQGQLEPGRFRHRLAAVSPRLRHAHDPALERAAAGAAPAPGPEGNGGVPPDVRTRRA